MGYGICGTLTCESLAPRVKICGPKLHPPSNASTTLSELASYPLAEEQAGCSGKSD